MFVAKIIKGFLPIAWYFFQSQMVLSTLKSAEKEKNAERRKKQKSEWNFEVFTVIQTETLDMVSPLTIESRHFGRGELPVRGGADLLSRGFSCRNCLESSIP